jgi:hypothetical protein
MSRIDKILAKRKALADELEMAKQDERDAVLKDINEKIKLLNFKTSDFKCVTATRKNRGTVTAAKKTAPKRTAR